ncbi:EF-hand domain-containing protein 1-like [Melanaphis sacchari]|uniref:EF-hand domain-containing protein 1-like n=1 Tax=Melanaphis sacchari TaxID=742174 RepID=UPI000DC13684|nr:EF-hand domain-containing protein 1-like [Melanaphis sacchari]
MDRLPFIPGFRFNDITKQYFNLSAQFHWKNGYALPKVKSTGIGKSILDVDTILYGEKFDIAGYDPTLTYGKAKDDPRPIDPPNFVKFDRKCLSFIGYTQHTINNSPIETFRVRKVKITYFLVDDTITVVEPFVKNAGYVQGCLLKRGQIPNPNREGRPWHWSDFIIGGEVNFYGTAYRLCGCDMFTRKYLTSMGMEVVDNQRVIDDPYTAIRQQKLQWVNEQPKLPSLASDGKFAEDKLRQFLEYDGKVLRFYATWNSDISDPTECKHFIIVYYLTDDRLEINESKTMGNNCGQNLSPVFLSKMKLPKHWSTLPPNFPSIYLEAGNDEYQEYYRPRDFIIGNTISVMGRRFKLYDCDPFTRDYFRDMLKIVQPEPIQTIKLKNNKLNMTQLAIPPHTGIGDPDDTRQNCLSLIPKPPKTLDFVTFVLNATKKLRYKLKMVPVYEIDNLRNFIMEYCIGNDQMSIVELASKNSGFTKGRFMAATRLRKPGTSIDSNEFYGPKDFAIGAELYAKGLVFIITELDVWSYNYMNENKDMFTQDAIDGAKLFLESKNLLNSQENANEISVPESTPILSAT